MCPKDQLMFSVPDCMAAGYVGSGRNSGVALEHRPAKNRGRQAAKTKAETACEGCRRREEERDGEPRAGGEGVLIDSRDWVEELINLQPKRLSIVRAIRMCVKAEEFFH